MATSQVTKFSFTCFTLYQTTITHDPIRRHPSPTSKMVGFHSFCLLPISVNKQELATIQENQIRTLQHQKILLPPEHHSKYIKAKENFKSFSRAHRFHLVKDTTISSSKTPTLYVKIVTHIHYDNGFELLTTVVFNISPQLRGLVHKAQDGVMNI